MNPTPSPGSPVLETLPERFNVAAHLLAVNAERGNKLAYIDDTTRLTYGELDERVRRCAAGLQRLGLRCEDRVLLAMHDSIDFPIAFLGALNVAGDRRGVRVVRRRAAADS